MGRVCDLLVVDDDTAQLQLLQLLLRELDLPHQCHNVTSGDAALDFLHRRHPYESAPRPQLILLDLNLPGKTGCDVLRDIKSDPDLRLIPVIIFSQSRSKSDIQACYTENANAYISKPTDLDGNIKIIEAIEHFWLKNVQLPE
jgi:CheY-like chemotaxis protein